MKDKNLPSEEYVENYYQIVREKLLGLQKFGSGDVIHDVNSHLFKMYNERIWWKKYHEIHNLITWLEYTKSAEIFMQNLTKNKFGRK